MAFKTIKYGGALSYYQCSACKSQAYGKTKPTKCDVCADLPKGITPGDVPFAVGKERYELILTTAFGWCIATLGIRRNTRSSTGDRTYAVTLDGRTVRVGMGPHVKRRVSVHLIAAHPFAVLAAKGSESANEIRDRISSRRAATALRRYF